MLSKNTLKQNKRDENNLNKIKNYNVEVNKKPQINKVKKTSK